MKKICLIIGALLLLFDITSAQSNYLDKKMAKAYSLAEKGKLKEADEYVSGLLKENSQYGDGWDYLCKLRYQEYNDSKLSDNIFSGKITVTTKNEKGEEIKAENDSLSNALMSLLNDIKPSKIAYAKYKYTLRKATLLSNEAVTASYTLRANYIDAPVDTAVSKKALKYFYDAESEFEKKNYNSAAKLYKRAMEEQPDFYKASLYMGDCFYFVGNYLYAITSFKNAVERFPMQLEPRKYLVDAYAKERLYEKALEEAINCMTVYPDQSVLMKLDDAAFVNNKRIDIKWTQRGVFPNMFAADSSTTGLNSYHDPDSLVVNAPWTIYRDACPQMKDYCNEKGIIVKPNNLTKSDYLELYSWEQMLANSSDPALDEAKRMQKDGFLDCYVLVTCFHYDIYDQYLDFVTKNKDKVIEYYNKYLVRK